MATYNIFMSYRAGRVCVNRLDKPLAAMHRDIDPSVVPDTIICATRIGADHRDVSVDGHYGIVGQLYIRIVIDLEAGFKAEKIKGHLITGALECCEKLLAKDVREGYIEVTANLIEPGNMLRGGAWRPVEESDEA